MPRANAGTCRPYSVLLPVGFTLPPPLPAARCALAAPFRPCPQPGDSDEPSGRAGGLFSVALSLGSPPPAVSRHRSPVEPGLSSTAQGANPGTTATVQPSGERTLTAPPNPVKGPPGQGPQLGGTTTGI